MNRLILPLCASICLVIPAQVQSAALPSDRGRVTVASIPDPYGGPNLKVLRTDSNTPLRAGTAWIWEKQGQEEPGSYYVSMRAKGLNAVRMILFDTWEVEAYPPGPQFTPTDWNDAAYRTRQLARMERSVNHASANGMYVIINSHNKIPNYNESYVNALWTHVAPYFANRTHVLYELANEPMSGIGTVALAPIPQSLSANIAALVQEIVNRPGWASGNAIAFLIRGSGHRTADAFDKAGGTPARLAVRYSLDTTSMSYNRWVSDHPVLTGGNALETADPDFDSLSNLMKFSQP